MRILHIPHAYHPVIGGAELTCRKVGEILAAQGHDVHVLTTDVGAVQAYYEYGIESVVDEDAVVHGVAVERLRYCGGLYWAGGHIEGRLLPAWLSRRIAGRIRRHLNDRLQQQITSAIVRLRPDVVMTMPHLVINVQAVLQAHAMLRFPLVMVPLLHEHAPNWNIAAMAKALRQADAAVALTRHEAHRLVEAYGLAPEQVFMSSVGIDVEVSAASPSGRPPIVIYFGRQARSKGIGELIEAMGVVWATRPDAELVIAGVRVPESVEIDAQIAALPACCQGRIRSLGGTSDTEKAELLRSACCLVIPSRIESFGMVILDAWAQVTPVIAWDLPVFRDTVDDGENGLLADPREGVRALAHAILRLLASPSEAARMGIAGYRKAAATYSWRKVADVYLEAYHHAVGRARPECG